MVIRGGVPLAIVDFLDTYFDRWHPVESVALYVLEVGATTNQASVKRALRRLSLGGRIEQRVVDGLTGRFRRVEYRGQFPWEKGGQ